MDIIYTYRSGKMKCLKQEMSYYCGGEPTYIYPSKNVIACTQGDDWSSQYIYYEVGKKMKKISNVDVSDVKRYSLSSGKYKMRKHKEKQK